MCRDEINGKSLPHVLKSMPTAWGFLREQWVTDTAKDIRLPA